MNEYCNETNEYSNYTGLGLSVLRRHFIAFADLVNKTPNSISVCGGG